MWTMSTRSPHQRNTYSTDNIINTNNIDVTQSDKQGNSNNTVSINNTDNMGASTTDETRKNVTDSYENAINLEVIDEIIEYEIVQILRAGLGWFFKYKTLNKIQKVKLANFIE